LTLLLDLSWLVQNVPIPFLTTPTIAVTSPPPTQLPAILPPDTSACVPWNEITGDLEGEVRCVYGEVTFSRDFSNNGEFYTLVRFGNDPRSLYLLSQDRTLVLANVGDCVSAEAVIYIDGKGVPFMEPSEISRNKHSCME
jgi:hypothetical protein